MISKLGQIFARNDSEIFTSQLLYFGTVKNAVLGAKILLESNEKKVLFRLSSDLALLPPPHVFVCNAE